MSRYYMVFMNWDGGHFENFESLFAYLFFGGAGTITFTSNQQIRDTNLMFAQHQPKNRFGFYNFVIKLQ